MTAVRYCRFSIVPITLVFAIGVATYAQSSVVLTPESPIVLEHLIRLHSALDAEVQRRSAEDPGKATAFRHAVANIFGVSDDGYTRLRVVLANARQLSDGVQAKRNQYLASLAATHSLPSDPAMRAFYNEQLSALKQIMPAIQAQLSPSDWQGFRNFVQVELVGKIKVGVTNATTTKP